ncbi:hypothetical protein ABFS82_09G027400 [Erythranthe guttata]|uniref:CCB3 n=1 Tax=Erythranthe guttata TaxID=4155 RepID=A0A022RUB4_ERYGU|nr:PREDICTED: uncharacterized protein LOC105952158 [Erythranthe guttata]EYU42515.1 hypothetical protein MIMGU_mgv1a014382mg [Erythranthe guttata]|eukprot:XP_012831128.1 PREDICTED: uncharacterized protein LOC105952158 [Erythranthe guttata]
MSNLSAPIVGISISWLPSKPRNQTRDHQNSSPHLSTHKSRNPRNNHICRAHYSSSEIPIPLSSASSINAPLDAITATIPQSKLLENLVLADLDPATAKVAIGLLGPFLSGFGFLFIARIVMSWYPKLPLEEFPYVLAYAPTEPLLVQTRKVIPPLAGVDVTPVVWFGLLSFMNEILVGPQGLLVLLSQQKV